VSASLQLHMYNTFEKQFKLIRYEQIKPWSDCIQSGNGNVYIIMEITCLQRTAFVQCSELQMWDT